MHKVIYLLDVDNYEPQIKAFTRPFIKAYADKIDAEIHIINKRKFKQWPVTYEKLQIKEIAESNGADWHIYIDSDALVHNDTVDYTELISKDTVLHNGVDFNLIRWKPNSYFRRDGRHIGSCNWFTVASDWCLDLWTPLPMTPQAAIAQIQPTNNEQLSGVIDAPHLVDDYALSYNIAKYGLKFDTVLQINDRIKMNAGGMWHAYDIPTDQKLKQMSDVLAVWSGVADWVDGKVVYKEPTNT